MPKVEVCLSPDLLHLHPVEGKTVVVVDVLRASSCITAGIGSGVRSITPVATLEECRGLQEQGYVGAAERGGRQADGFDIGNSPFSFMASKLKDRKIAMTTTNGTLAITKSKSSEQVLVGSFLNLGYLANYLRERPRDIVILCAGWKGRFSLEDTLFAGGLVEELGAFYDYEDDSAMAAEHLYQGAQGDLFSYLSGSSHFNRLKRLNLVKDIEYCLTLDQFEVIPVLNGTELVKGNF